MRILFCGDRNWTDKQTILLAMKFWKPSLVIEGEARGADIMARECAQELNIPFIPFPAQWKTLGRRAGPIRNQQMLDEGLPDMVLAFHNNIDKSKGTKDMVTRANLAGIRVIIYGEGMVNFEEVVL